MHNTAVVALLACFVAPLVRSQLPFLNVQDIAQLTRLATNLAASAASNVAQNERDVLNHPQRPPVQREISLDQRPSEIVGQSMHSVLSPTLHKLIESVAPSKSSEEPLRPIAAAAASSTMNPLLQLASVFLSAGGSPASQSASSPRRDIFVSDLSEKTVPTRGRPPALALFGQPTASAGRAAAGPRGPRQLRTAGGGTASNRAAAAGMPNIEDIMPGARSNFNLPKGRGCLPLLSEFMEIAYGDCVRQADARVWDSWGNELGKLGNGRPLDIIGVSKQTCKRGAERELCSPLRQAVSTCDIMASLRIGAQLQRALERCEQVTGIIDQNPVTMFNQVNSLIGGEVAQGFLNRFLKG